MENLLQNADQMILLHKNVFFPPELRVLYRNQKNFKFVKIRKKNEEREYFENKTAVIFLEGIFNETFGRKICHW